jgi:hypothetical protein
MATMITYACSVCSKLFGENHLGCMKASRGQCRAAGAVVQRVPISVGIHDRIVGGKVAANQRHGLGSESDSDAILLDIFLNILSDIILDILSDISSDISSDI